MNECFLLALKVMVKEVYMPHSINMLNRLKKSPNTHNRTQTILLNWIQTKDNFNRVVILEKAKELGVKDLTVSDVLNRFIELDLMKKVSHGLDTNK